MNAHWPCVREPYRAGIVGVPARLANERLGRQAVEVLGIDDGTHCEMQRVTCTEKRNGSDHSLSATPHGGRARSAREVPAQRALGQRIERRCDIVRSSNYVENGEAFLLTGFVKHTGATKRRWNLRECSRRVCAFA